jgi:hypothetical protein
MVPGFTIAGARTQSGGFPAIQPPQFTLPANLVGDVTLGASGQRGGGGGGSLADAARLHGTVLPEAAEEADGLQRRADLARADAESTRQMLRSATSPEAVENLRRQLSLDEATASRSQAAAEAALRSHTGVQRAHDQALEQLARSNPTDWVQRLKEEIDRQQSDPARYRESRDRMQATHAASRRVERGERERDMRISQIRGDATRRTLDLSEEMRSELRSHREVVNGVAESKERQAELEGMAPRLSAAQRKELRKLQADQRSRDKTMARLAKRHKQMAARVTRQAHSLIRELAASSNPSDQAKAKYLEAAVAALEAAANKPLPESLDAMEAALAMLQYIIGHGAPPVEEEDEPPKPPSHQRAAGDLGPCPNCPPPPDCKPPAKWVCQPRGAPPAPPAPAVTVTETPPDTAPPGGAGAGAGAGAGGGGGFGGGDDDDDVGLGGHTVAPTDTRNGPPPGGERPEDTGTSTSGPQHGNGSGHKYPVPCLPGLTRWGDLKAEVSHQVFAVGREVTQSGQKRVTFSSGRHVFEFDTKSAEEIYDRYEGGAEFVNMANFPDAYFVCRSPAGESAIAHLALRLLLAARDSVFPASVQAAMRRYGADLQALGLFVVELFVGEATRKLLELIRDGKPITKEVWLGVFLDVLGTAAGGVLGAKIMSSLSRLGREAVEGAVKAAGGHADEALAAVRGLDEALEDAAAGRLRTRSVAPPGAPRKPPVEPPGTRPGIGERPPGRGGSQTPEGGTASRPQPQPHLAQPATPEGTRAPTTEPARSAAPAAPEGTPTTAPDSTPSVSPASAPGGTPSRSTQPSEFTGGEGPGRRSPLLRRGWRHGDRIPDRDAGIDLLEQQGLDRQRAADWWDSGAGARTVEELTPGKRYIRYAPERGDAGRGSFLTDRSYGSAAEAKRALDLPKPPRYEQVVEIVDVGGTVRGIRSGIANGAQDATQIALPRRDVYRIIEERPIR